MAAKEMEKTSVTGLGEIPAKEYKEAEYDLVSSLLEAAEFRTSEDAITKVNIARKGKFLFSVRIRPLSDEEVKVARKEAGIYKPNPAGKKLGKIRVETDDAKFTSWIIYLATVEEDQQKIWGNQAVLQKYNLFQPWQSVDKLLTSGEKANLIHQVFEVSGLNDDDEDGGQDEESFHTVSD